MIHRHNKFLILLLIIFIYTFHVNMGIVIAANNEIMADEITLNTENGEQKIIAEGNARIVYGSLTFTGETIYYNSDSANIQLSENIVLTDEDYTIKGDTLDGNLEQGVFTVTSAEELVEITGPDLYAAAGVINYNRQEGTVVMEEHPALTYKEVEASADIITYNLQEKTATLSGNVKGIQGEGRQFAADTIDINMETDKIKMSGGANLIFKETDSALEDEE